jgi:hypothetical protein
MSRSGSQRLAGMVRMLGEDVQAMACTTPTPLTCPRRTPSLGAVSALHASMGAARRSELVAYAARAVGGGTSLS